VHTLCLGEECRKNKLEFSETYVPATGVLSILQVLGGLDNFGNCLEQLMSMAKVTSIISENGTSEN